MLHLIRGRNLSRSVFVQNYSHLVGLCAVLGGLVLVAGCQTPPVLTCPNNGNCDDGNFCNGVETCDTATGQCVAGAPPCAANEVCNEATNVCDPACTSNANCDDGNFCNGSETCDVATGACVAGTAPCTAGQICSEATDACLTSCTTDADCNDGVFCNGTETCDGATGTCLAGTNPCSAGQTCVEASDTCFTPGQSFELKLNQDIFTGGDGNDTFTANLEFNPPTGTSLPTLQTGDTLDGGNGGDTLTATLNLAAPATITPSLTSIETVNLSDLGSAATTLAGDNIVGATAFNLSNGINPNAFIFTNLAALAHLGLSSQGVGASMTFLTAATSGASDAMSLTLANTTGGIVTVTTGATNGVETLNIVSNGTSNTLTAFNHVTGASMTAVNTSGAGSLKIERNAPLPTTATSINAAGSTGPTDLTVGGAANVTYIGGSGNDIINFAGTYTTSDTIDGGGGTNTLGLNANLAAVAVTQSNVSNIQSLMIVNTLLGETIDVTRFGASDVVLDSTGAVLLLNLPSNITIAAGNRAITCNNDDINDQINITLSGVGVDDILTINANNSDQSFGATGFDVFGAETVNYVSGNGPDGTAADGGANTILNLKLTPTAGTGIVNITGNVSFRPTQEIKASTINASAAGAAFVHETESGSVNATSATITGSAFNDELVGSNGNDNITAGEGNDILKGRDGADILTGGAGADQCFLDAFSQFGDAFTDFVAGTDQVGLGSGIVDFAGIAGTEAAPIALTASNFETSRASITAIAAGDALKIVRISVDQTTTQITTGVGAAVAAFALVFDSTLSRGVLFHDADWSSTAGRVLVVRFENITTLAGLQAVNFTDFLEIN